ncbi:MAG: hypothetical protein AAGC46_01490 [Solirubrobacteraceae bacterium]|nr:hypothetical protein [Patulibacter sp.]
MFQGKFRRPTTHVRGGAALVAALAVGGALAATAVAAGLAGDPDPTFGTGGAIDVGGLPSPGTFAIAVQPDGKVVSSDPGRVIRLTAAGQPDQSFGVSGVTAFPAQDGAGHEFVNTQGLAVDKQGRILVVGETFFAGTEGDTALLRLLPDGTVDPSFGSGGVLSINVLAGQNETGQAVAVDAQGRYVIAGTVGSDATKRMSVIRIYDTGNPDTTFSGDGLLTLTASVATQSESIAFDGTDIVVAGEERPAADTTPSAGVVARINTSGTPVQTFGTNGQARTPLLAGMQTNTVVALPDHRLRLVGGTAVESAMASQRGVITGFTATGQPDAAVGPGGQRVYDLSPGTGSSFTAAAVVGSQLVVTGIGGLQSGATGVTPSLGRLSFDGAPDAAFGSGGFVALGSGSGFDVASAIAVQPDGNLVTTGFTADAAFEKLTTRIRRSLGQNVPVSTPAPTPVPTAVPTPAPTPTPAPKLPTVPSSVKLSTARLSDGRTRIKSATVKGLKKGDVVTYACATKARGCTKAASAKTTVKTGTSLTITALKNLKLAPKATLTITVARSGYTARTVTFTMVKKKAPTQTSTPS